MPIINTGVPSFKLEELVIRQCSLEKLPDWFYKQEKLTYVDLWQNDIQIISENIENLRKLKFFRLGFNRLKNLPENLKNMKSLKFLDIRGNLWPKSFDYSSFSHVKDFYC
jgi:Leucine-rich repeat (LRR) protein